VKSGEGVYGLQRAFIVAGAGALIMSLWKVERRSNASTHDGFLCELAQITRQAESIQASTIDVNANLEEPYYWGAFVMMGCNWGPWSVVDGPW